MNRVTGSQELPYIRVPKFKLLLSNQWYTINNTVNPVDPNLHIFHIHKHFNHTRDAKIGSGKEEVGRFQSGNIFGKICHSTNRRRGGCLKYYPRIVSLFSFSPPSPPLLGSPPSRKWNTDLVGGPRQLSMSSSSISSPRWRRYFNLARGPRNVRWKGAVWGRGNAHG